MDDYLVKLSLSLISLVIQLATWLTFFQRKFTRRSFSKYISQHYVSCWRRRIVSLVTHRHPMTDSQCTRCDHYLQRCINGATSWRKFKVLDHKHEWSLITLRRFRASIVKALVVVKVEWKNGMMEWMIQLNDWGGLQLFIHAQGAKGAEGTHPFGLTLSWMVMS